MYTIALCDDESVQLRNLKSMLAVYQEQRSDCELEIECFRSAEALLGRVLEGDYEPDLFLLDIYLQEDEFGIETAGKLRDMGNKSQIVFITSSMDHALEAYRVQAAQYLVKPVEEEELFVVLDRLLEEKTKEQRRFLVLRANGSVSRVAVDRIVYCEAQGKSQKMYLEDGEELLLHMTMTEIFAKLSDYQEFVKVGASYIVNLEHIASLNAREAVMETEANIRLPRGSYQPLRERYFKYYCEKK